MAIFLPNGIGGTTGHSLATRKPTVAYGVTWYVGPGGVDAVSPAGQRREAPLLTLAQAHTNAAAGDTIVILQNHVQSLAVAQVFNKIGINVVCEGTGSTRPRFICTGAVAMFDVTAAAVRFFNVYFPASTAVPLARIRIASSGCTVEDCYFECGTSDSGQTVAFVTGWASGTVKGCTFLSTAATPDLALRVTNAGTGLVLTDLIFDGGSFGWINAAASIAAAAGVCANNISQLNDSDVVCAGSTGLWVIGASSGSALIQ